MSTTETRRPRGRPRDPSIDGRVLAAAREVVSLVGTRAASMSAIADRAGVGKPTIYLRWPNIGDLLADALAGAVTTEQTRARFRAASVALDALAREPEGQFLIEALLLPSGAAIIDEAAEAA